MAKEDRFTSYLPMEGNAIILQPVRPPIGRFLVLLILAVTYCKATRANDSCSLQISLLTCSPGSELYSTFGHSAIRLKDPNTNTDIVFNYGTFNFDDPGFYRKFTRGKLDYFLSVSDYSGFLESYKEEKRIVYEQILNLTCPQKQRLQLALQENTLPEHRFYRYDFIKNNCTTRIRDLLLDLIDSSTLIKFNLPQNSTARKLIHQYLDQGGKQWSKLGIDVLLGSKIDQKLNASGTMFLPEYLMKGVAEMKVNEKRPLVAKKQALLMYSQVPETSKVNTPFLVFSLLTLVMGLVYISKSKNGSLVFLFDTLLFGVTGLIGVLLCFMWWGTNHEACSSNYNLLWALPFNLVALAFVRKGSKWIKLYCIMLAVISSLLLLFWPWLPQQLNVAIVPVAMLLLVRSLQIVVTIKQEKKINGL